MGHLYKIKLADGFYIIRDVLADRYLKFHQVNSNGSELPVWCHAITAAGKFTESEIADVSANLANLGYKIHDAR